jgi:hypothetical protein
LSISSMSARPAVAYSRVDRLSVAPLPGKPPTTTWFRYRERQKGTMLSVMPSFYCPRQTAFAVTT